MTGQGDAPSGALPGQPPEVLEPAPAPASSGIDAPSALVQAPASALPRAMQPDTWLCPICLDLMHLPVVSECGHATCFWCCHAAMNPFKPSTCPLCRTPYVHLPKVCGALHTFLTRQFPAQYAARQLEAEGQIQERGVSLPVVPVPEPDAPGAEPLTEVEAACAVGVCGHLGKAHVAVAPVALRCGHLVCDACLAGLRTKSAASGGCHGGTTPAASTCDGSVNCPACGQQGVAGPSSNVCLLLDEMLRTVHPQAWESSKALHQQHPPPEMATTVLGDTDSAATPEPSPAGHTRPRGQRCASVLPHLDSMLQSEALSPADKWGLVRNEVLRHADTMFSWYFVGCDQCGVYPIVGRRYQCQDCPDAIGYDECGACHDATQAAGVCRVGRFNQAHTSAHRMRKLEPDLELTSLAHLLDDDMGKMQGCLNCLAVLHPELDPEQIVGEVALQLMGLFVEQPQGDALGMEAGEGTEPATQNGD